MTRPRQIRFGAFVAVLAIATSIGWSASVWRVEAAVYWGNGGYVGAANLDASAADWGYFTPPYPSAAWSAEIRDVAVNSKYLFWLGSSGIGRVNLDGPTVSEVVVSGIPEPCGLAATESHIYWTSCSAKNTVDRANLDGSEASTFVKELSQPCDVAVDARHVYWGDWGGIGRANLDGGEVERSFISSATHPCGLAVTDRYMYWSDDQRSIARANIDGGEANNQFITGTGVVAGLAANSANLFWTNDYQDGLTRATVGRASLDGTDINQSWVTSNRIDLSGVAVEARTSLSPLPLPSQPIRFGKVRHDRRTGTVFLDVWAWEGGELTVVAPRIGWKVIGDSVPPGPGGAMRLRLKLWPGKIGEAARHIRQQLKGKGRSRVILRVSYAEAGKTPIEKNKRLAFSRKRQSRR